MKKKMEDKIITVEEWRIRTKNNPYNYQTYKIYENTLLTSVHYAPIRCTLYDMIVTPFSFLYRRFKLCRCYILNEDKTAYVFAGTHRFRKCPRRSK